MEISTHAANFPPSQSIRLRNVPTAQTSVFLPREHGSWSLALEPLCLGLLVAPSRAGAALTLAALAAFFARRPLKTALTANSISQRQCAIPALGLLVIIAAIGLFQACWFGGLPALWPLLFVVPLGGLFLYFDLQNNSRAAIVEIVGSSAFALLPAAIASLAGWSAAAALALTVVALARSLPTVLTIRTYLRQAKGQETNALLPLLAAGLAFAILLGLDSVNLIPGASVVGAALLLGRSAWLLSYFRPSWPARRIGQLEAGFGLVYLGIIAKAYHTI